MRSSHRRATRRERSRGSRRVRAARRAASRRARAARPRRSRRRLRGRVPDRRRAQRGPAVHRDGTPGARRWWRRSSTRSRRRTCSSGKPSTRARAVRLRAADRYVAFGERQRDVHRRAHARVAQPDAALGVPGRERDPVSRDTLLGPDARPHPHRRRPLQGPHQRLGRRQRGAGRGRHAAPLAVAARSSATTTSPRRSSSPTRPIPARSCTTTTTRSRTPPSGTAPWRWSGGSRRRASRSAAIGLQGHDKLDWPTVAQQDSTIAAFAALGVKVMITELDVDVLPRPDEPQARTSRSERRRGPS